MKALITIDQSIDENTVREIQLLLMDILKSGAEQETIRVALKTVEGMFRAAPVTVSDCTLTNEKSKN